MAMGSVMKRPICGWLPDDPCFPVASLVFCMGRGPNGLGLSHESAPRTSPRCLKTFFTSLLLHRPRNPTFARTFRLSHVGRSRLTVVEHKHSARNIEPAVTHISQWESHYGTPENH